MITASGLPRRISRSALFTAVVFRMYDPVATGARLRFDKARSTPAWHPDDTKRPSRMRNRKIFAASSRLVAIWDLLTMIGLTGENRQE
jgi:hypothetical protein